MMMKIMMMMIMITGVNVVMLVVVRVLLVARLHTKMCLIVQDNCTKQMSDIFKKTLVTTIFPE